MQLPRAHDVFHCGTAGIHTEVFNAPACVHQQFAAQFFEGLPSSRHARERSQYADRYSYHSLRPAHSARPRLDDGRKIDAVRISGEEQLTRGAGKRCATLQDLR